jgi:hypothetical protein
MEPLIIGIGNRMRHGKDQFASYLRSALYGEVDYNIVIKTIHFADPIKDALIATFGLDCRGLYGSADQRNSPIPDWVGEMLGATTHREAMQQYGCAMRDKYPGIWVKAALENPANKGVDVVIVADMRFQDEFDAIAAKGGYMIQVNRPDVEPNDHSSEGHLDDADYNLHINNDGDLNQLKQTAEMVATWIVTDGLLPTKKPL